MSNYIGQTIKVKSANEAFSRLFELLQGIGLKASPRGYKTRELINTSIVITNPRDRIVTCLERKFDLGYAFGELAWYLSKRNDLNTMAYYSKMMNYMSDDGKTLNSAYGYRIFGKHEKIGFNQFENVINLLKEDKDSRQAIIHLHTPNNQKTKDEVCTLTLQFIVRENKLHMIVNMRSNDLVLGFPYDVFSFTMFQEIMANELGLDLGDYCHNVGSLHYYCNNYYPDEKVIQNRTCIDFGEMKPFSWKLNNFDGMLNYEEYVRTKVCNFDFTNEQMNLWVTAEIQSLLSEEQENKELICMYETAFIVKMLRRKKDYKCLNSVLNVVRQNNEDLANILLLGCKCFDKSANKIIVEGVDGSGKTLLVKKLMQENPSYCMQHYSYPTESFSYDDDYLFNLQNDYSIIFDRFFISELVYSKVFNRRCEISFYNMKNLKYQCCKNENVQLIFIVATDEGQVQIIKDRLKERKEAFNDKKIRALNNEYINMAKYFKKRKVNKINVKIIDVCGREVEW
jgi:thymidylate synthase